MLPDGIVRYDRLDLDAWVDARGAGAPRRGDGEWLKDLSEA